MTAPRKIKCEQHGEQEVALVCQHIVEGLRKRQPVGFFWSAKDKSFRPDAWCSACEERVRKTGGEWTGEAVEHLGAKILCGTCYDIAKALNFPSEK